MSGHAPKLEVNKHVAALTGDGGGAKPMVKFNGYVGKSDQEGKVRLHFSLNDLSQYVEFDEKDVMLTAEAPENVLPLGGVYVWVRGATHLRLVRTVQLTASNLAAVVDIRHSAMARRRNPWQVRAPWCRVPTPQR